MALARRPRVKEELKEAIGVTQMKTSAPMVAEEDGARATTVVVLLLPPGHRRRLPLPAGPKEDAAVVGHLPVGQRTHLMQHAVPIAPTLTPTRIPPSAMSSVPAVTLETLRTLATNLTTMFAATISSRSLARTVTTRPLGTSEFESRRLERQLKDSLPTPAEMVIVMAAARRILDRAGIS